MTLTEKVAYLKGLAEGLALDENEKDTKVFKAIFDILEDVALSVTDLEDTVELVEEQLDAVDEDLDDLESYVYENDFSCECDDDDFEDDDDMYEVNCPSCNETFCINGEKLNDEFVECPNCGEKLDLGLDFDCDCGDEEDSDNE